MSLPLIGITTVRHKSKVGRVRDALTTDYARAIIEAGGVPLLIPLSTMETSDERLLRTIYERVDGIMLPGGGDVHPEFYGDYVTDMERSVSRLRDKVELTLVHWAYEDDRPLFGICRGHQVLNVALGGTLMHDIRATLNGSALEHDQQGENNRSRLYHNVEIKAGSALAKAVGTTNVSVNSLHHQAVLNLAPPLTATAFSSDGLNEGIEVEGARFFVGVQWHPEAIFDLVPAMQTLFSNFVRACGVA